MSNTIAISDPITISSSAIAKVWELMEEENNLALNLRVFVTGGGCSGLQYGFSFDELVNSDDTVVKRSAPQDEGKENGGEELGSVQFVIDAMSLQYLMGAEIDYTEDVQGSQFIIRNPNAQTTCGCGSSFSA